MAAIDVLRFSGATSAIKSSRSQGGKLFRPWAEKHLRLARQTQGLSRVASIDLMELWKREGCPVAEQRSVQAQFSGGAVCVAQFIYRLSPPNL